jgi:hypothetical protein
MERDASRDGSEACPGTEEEGDGDEEPDHPEVPPRVSNACVRTFAVHPAQSDGHLQCLLKEIEVRGIPIASDRVRRLRERLKAGD